LSVNSIHKLLRIPYQQVRNVIHNPRKRDPSKVHIINIGGPNEEEEVATLSEGDLALALKESKDG
jgi:hypothetical protein